MIDGMMMDWCNDGMSWNDSWNDYGMVGWWNGCCEVMERMLWNDLMAGMIDDGRNDWWKEWLMEGMLWNDGVPWNGWLMEWMLWQGVIALVQSYYPLVVEWMHVVEWLMECMSWNEWMSWHAECGSLWSALVSFIVTALVACMHIAVVDILSISNGVHVQAIAGIGFDGSTRNVYPEIIGQPRSELECLCGKTIHTLWSQGGHLRYRCLRRDDLSNADTIYLLCGNAKPFSDIIREVLKCSSCVHEASSITCEHRRDIQIQS